MSDSETLPLRFWGWVGTVAAAFFLPTFLGLWTLRTAMPIDDGLGLVAGAVVVSLGLVAGWIRARSRREPTAVLWILAALFTPLPLLAGAVWVNVALDGSAGIVDTEVVRVEHVNPPGEGPDQFYAMLTPWDGEDEALVAVPITESDYRVHQPVEAPLPMRIEVGAGALGVRWIAVDGSTLTLP